MSPQRSASPSEIFEGERAYEYQSEGKVNEGEIFEEEHQSEGGYEYQSDARGSGVIAHTDEGEVVLTYAQYERLDEISDSRSAGGGCVPIKIGERWNTSMAHWG